MTTMVLVIIGVTTWLVLSGPIALVLAQVLRRRGATYPPAPNGDHERIDEPDLLRL